jgi:hypothetical protein
MTSLPSNDALASKSSAILAANVAAIVAEVVEQARTGLPLSAIAAGVGKGTR